MTPEGAQGDTEHKAGNYPYPASLTHATQATRGAVLSRVNSTPHEPEGETSLEGERVSKCHGHGLPNTEILDVLLSS